jgi:hypothetical protein
VSSRPSPPSFPRAARRTRCRRPTDAGKAWTNGDSNKSGMNLLLPLQHCNKLLNLPRASLRFFHRLNSPKDRIAVRPVKSPEKCCGPRIRFLSKSLGCPVQDCIFRLHVLRWRFGFGPDPKQRRAPGWPRFAYGLSADVTRRISLRDNPETRVASCHEPLKATGATMSMEPVYRLQPYLRFLA